MMNMRVEEEEPGNPVHGALRAENMNVPQTRLVRLVLVKHLTVKGGRISSIHSFWEQILGPWAESQGVSAEQTDLEPLHTMCWKIGVFHHLRSQIQHHWERCCHLVQAGGGGCWVRLFWESNGRTERQEGQSTHDNGFLMVSHSVHTCK